MGLIESNPASIPGVADITEFFIRQVYPENAPEPLPVINVHGDGLSVLRTIQAKQACLQARDPRESLATVNPCPQEFHKEAALNQVRTQITQNFSIFICLFTSNRTPSKLTTRHQASKKGEQCTTSRKDHWRLNTLRKKKFSKLTTTQLT
jgi:hypothetical protein